MVVFLRSFSTLPIHVVLIRNTSLVLAKTLSNSGLVSVGPVRNTPTQVPNGIRPREGLKVEFTSKAAFERGFRSI